MDQHHEPRALTALGVFEHGLIAVGVAKGHDRPAPYHEMDVHGLRGLVIDPQQLRVLGENRPAVRRAYNLIARNAVHPLGIRPHEVLPAPVTMKVL